MRDPLPEYASPLDRVVQRILALHDIPCAPNAHLAAQLLPEGAKRINVAGELEDIRSELRGDEGTPDAPVERALFLPPPRVEEKGAASMGRSTLTPVWSGETTTPTPEAERAWDRLLVSVPGRVRTSDLVIVVAPMWVLADSTELADTRRHYLHQGVLARIVQIPGPDGTSSGWVFVVCRGRHADASSWYHVPFLVRQRPLPHIEWERVELQRESSHWLPADMEALRPEHLTLASVVAALGLESVPLSKLDEAVRDGRADTDFVRELLVQPPYVRAAVDGVLDIVVPLPNLDHQRELAARLRDHAVDVLELCDLLARRDPRDGAPLVADDSSTHMLEQLARVLKRLPPGAFSTTLLAWVQRLAGGDDARSPTIGSMARVYEATALVAQAAALPRRTQDLGIRIAMITAALREVEELESDNVLARVLKRGLRTRLLRERATAVGAPTLTFDIRHSRRVEEVTELRIDVRNTGRTPLFDLAAEFSWLNLESHDALRAQTDVLDSDERWLVTAEWTDLPHGESRLQIAWSARDVLGELVKGLVVLPYDIPRESLTIDDVEDLLRQGDWERLEQLARSDDLPAPASGLLSAMVAVRRGEHNVGAAALVDGAREGDEDEVQGLALFSSILGYDDTAREIAEAGWERNPAEGELALLVARVRHWAGDDGRAKALLYRALEELTVEAHGVLSAILVREGENHRAQEHLMGVELDDALRLALLPAWVLDGSEAEVDSLYQRIGDLERVSDLDVAWTTLDLIHLGEADFATRLVDGWRWGDDGADLKTLLQARIAHLRGDVAEATRKLADFFGSDAKASFRSEEKLGEPPPNPYVVGPPIRSRDGFFGRREELDQIASVIGGPTQQGVVLLEGERRTGKTSILHRVPDRLTADTLAVHVNLQSLGRAGDVPHFWTTVAKELWRATDMPVADRRSRADVREYEGFLDEVDAALTRTGMHSLLMLIDEFEVLDQAITESPSAADIVSQLRHLVQTRPVSAVIAGAHGLRRSRSQRRSPLFGLGVRIPVADLDLEAARTLIEQPCRPFFRWSAAAVEHALRLCGRQPYYLQHLCREVFEARRMRPIRRAVLVADIEALVPDVVVRAEEHLDDIYDDLDEVRQKILARCAEDPVLSPRGSLEDLVVEDVSSSEEAAAAKEVLEAVNLLIDRGILERPAPGYLRIRAGLLHHRITDRFPGEGP